MRTIALMVSGLDLQIVDDLYSDRYLDSLLLYFPTSVVWLILQVLQRVHNARHNILGPYYHFRGSLTASGYVRFKDRPVIGTFAWFVRALACGSWGSQYSQELSPLILGWARSCTQLEGARAEE